MSKLKLFFTICFSFLVLACSDSEEQQTLMVPRTVDQDPSLPSISVNGRQLHSEAYGNPNGTLVICIHGGPGSDYRYLLNAKDLANDGYRVVFYDQVGSGLSQRFDKTYYENLSLDQIFIDELTGVIAKYKIKNNQKVILLGHSWGAMLAVKYAGMYPDKINGLAVFEPGGLIWEDVVTYFQNSQKPSGKGNKVTNGDDHEKLDYEMALASEADNENTGDPGLKPEDFWRMGAVINQVSLEIGQSTEPNLAQGIEHFSKPVLFGYGDNKAYPDSWAQKVSSVFVHKELYKTPNVGHSGMFTNQSVWINKTRPKLLSYFNLL